MLSNVIVRIGDLARTTALKLGVRAHRWRLNQLLVPSFAGLGVIVMLHRVRPAGATLLQPGFQIGADALERYFQFARSVGWEAISISEVPDRIAHPRPRQFVCFTADDGYRDNLDVGLPLFRKYGVPLCVYVSTRLCERDLFYWWGGLEQLVLRNESLSLELQGERWELPAATLQQKRDAYNKLDSWAHSHPGVLAEEFGRVFRRYGIDAQQGLDQDLLDWDGVQELGRDPWVTIGSHAVTHTPLARLSGEAMREELAASRNVLEALLQEEVRHVAYPFGSMAACGRREFEAAQQVGYTTGVTTRRGNVFPEHAKHLLCLPRRAAMPAARNVRDVLFGTQALLRREPAFVAE